MKTYAVNWTIFLLGLAIMSLGISIVTVAGLGTTPISALPLVSAYISGLSFGQTTLIINMGMIVLQMILLRKNIKWLVLLLQLPLTYFFSVLIDISMNWIQTIELVTYWQKVAFSMLGNAVLALGVSFEIYSKAAILPGEGLVLAMALCSKKPFPKVKVFNDVSLVILAVILSYFYFSDLHGIREGTILSAIFVGVFVKGWLSLITLFSGRKITDKG